MSCRAITGSATWAAIVLCTTTWLPLVAEATPIDYSIEFAVDTVGGAIDPNDCPPVSGDPNGVGGFGCAIAAGDTYFGHFTIDDALLGDTGENLAAVVYDFVIEIAGIVWDYLAPYPDSAFYGFRGPDGLGSGSPGFDVVDGALANLRGGVYGASDPPYVDFSPLGADGGTNRFGAGDGRTWAYGDMRIARVPEPATWALGLIGVAAAGLARKRRRTAG
jgi:PEP-CTERM motif